MEDQSSLFETPEQAEERALAEMAAVRAARNRGTNTPLQPEAKTAKKSPVAEAEQLLAAFPDPAVRQAGKVMAAAIRDLTEDLARVKAGSALSSPDDNGVVLGEKDTSKAAALRNFPRSGSQRFRVLLVIAEHGPVTDDQIHNDRFTQIPKITTVHARRGELSKGGWIEAVAETGLSNLGNDATMYKVTERGRRAIQEYEQANGKVALSNNS